MMPTGSLHSSKIRTGLLDTDLALKHRIETLTALVSARRSIDSVLSYPRRRNILQNTIHGQVLNKR